jgi:mediator of RNA polymerase II transcription subunit 8
MATLTNDQIKVLEQSRQRLAQLTRSLGSLIASLNQSDPLPPWCASLHDKQGGSKHTVRVSNKRNSKIHRSSLQSQASIISNNLISVSEQLSDHRDLLSTLVAYPGPEYPGRTQANTLEQLLRTKLDPRVEDWVERGRIAGTEHQPTDTFAIAPSLAASAAQKKLTEADLAKLWEWAPIEANEEARRRNWGGNFTLEEREAGIQNVVTGLRKQLEDDEEDEDEDDEDEEEEGEDEMEIVGVHRKSGGNGVEFDIAPHHAHPVQPVVPLSDILRYMTTGRMA